MEDVSSWVARAGFQDYAGSFSELRVDGDMLLQLTETEIRDDIGLANGILRKRFMRDLRELKKRADYTSCDGGLMANFLSRISPDYKVYAYNLILKELTLDFMERLSPMDLDDMLKDSGVESSIHRHKIIEAVLSVEAEDASLRSDLSESGFSEPGTDVYISYGGGAGGGAELASLLRIQLEQRDRDMAVVAECHDSGGDQERALARVRDSGHYLLVLTPGTLDPCSAPAAPSSRLHLELAAALRSGAKIIPVTVDFSWPEPESLPQDIRAITSFNGVRWIHDYQVGIDIYAKILTNFYSGDCKRGLSKATNDMTMFQDACIDKLERFIKGDSSRVGSPFTLRRDSGRSTPVTSLSSPMVYHKTALKNRAISFENVNSSQST